MSTLTPAPVAITKVEPQQLHGIWPFVRRGIETIVHKLGDQNVDFVPEDIYVAIRTGTASLHLVTRGLRTLGYFVTYVQVRPFSGKKENFLWVAYSIPLRERLPDDNVPEAVTLSLDYIKQQAKNLGCERILHLSSRRGFQRWGFTPTITVWTLQLD